MKWTPSEQNVMSQTKNLHVAANEDSYQQSGHENISRYILNTTGMCHFKITQ